MALSNQNNGSPLTTMYDSVNPDAIPRDTLAVAGYVDGEDGTWTDADFAMFTKAYKISITRTTSVHLATVLDVENGAATPQSAPGWAHDQRAFGATPVICCSHDTFPQVMHLFNEANIPQPLYWQAWWNGKKNLPKHCVGHQWTSPVAPAPFTSPGDYDISVINNTFKQLGTKP